MSARYDLTDEQLQAESDLADELNADGLSPEDCSDDIEPHPEGEKRGGLVRVYYSEDDPEVRVFWDGETWCQYDG